MEHDSIQAIEGTVYLEHYAGFCPLAHREIGPRLHWPGRLGEAYCTVDPALWRDMQSKLQSFREEQAHRSAGKAFSDAWGIADQRASTNNPIILIWLVVWNIFYFPQ